MYASERCASRGFLCGDFGILNESSFEACCSIYRKLEQHSCKLVYSPRGISIPIHHQLDLKITKHQSSLILSSLELVGRASL